MDISKFILENLDTIIEEDFTKKLGPIAEELPNDEDAIHEDDCYEDMIEDLHYNMYDSHMIKQQALIKECLDKRQIILKSNNVDDGTIGETMKSTSTSVLEEENDEDTMYYFKLLNLFVLHYNKKYDKHEHFFIPNNTVKSAPEEFTSNQMELFYTTLLEYKIVKKEFGLDDIQNTDENQNQETGDVQMMKLLYNQNTDQAKIIDLFENYSGQLYSLEIEDLNLNLVSPSMIVCFNYLIEQNINCEWNIYTLKNE